MMFITGAANWWRGLSYKLKWWVGFFGVAAAAVVSGAQALPYIEPLIPAHRAYVRTYDSDYFAPWQKRVIQIQLQQDTERRDRLLAEEQKWELELQTPQASTLPQYHTLIQQRVDRIKKDLDTIDEQDKSLLKEPVSK